MIPGDTRIFLTRYATQELHLRPMLQWPDILYVLYDVLVEGIVIIPRGSKVYGTWISDNDPRIAAQFQLSV